MRERGTPTGGRLGAGAIVLGPAVLALGLTAYDLPVRSLWLDESATYSIVSQHGAALFDAMKHDGGNMLLYYALMHLVVEAFGHSTTVLRLPSVVANGVTCGALAAIGARLFSRRVGLCAGLLSAVSLPLVYWGQDARAYSMMVAFVTLSYLAFVCLVQDVRRAGDDPPHAGRRHRKGVLLWCAYVACLVFAAYMSFVSLLVVPAQLIALVWYRRRLRAVAAAVVVTAVACVPLLLLAHARGAGQLFWVPRPNLQSTAQIVELLASSALAPSFALTATSLPLLALTGLTLVAIGIVALRELRRHHIADGISPAAFAGVLVAAWLVLPVLLDLAESSVGQSIYESRYAMISIPAVAIGLAWGLLETGLPKLASVSAVVLFLALRGLQVLPTYGVSPEDWQEATSYLLGQARPGDCVAFYPSDGRMAFEYYLEAAHRAESSKLVPVLPTTPFRKVEPFVEDYVSLSGEQVAALPRSCRRVWLVSSHVGYPHSTPVSREHYEAYRKLVAELKSTYPLEKGMRFSYAARIEVERFSR